MACPENLALERGFFALAGTAIAAHFLSKVVSGFEIPPDSETILDAAATAVSALTAAIIGHRFIRDLKDLDSEN